MSTVIRIPKSVVATASPLGGIRMNPYERLQAERDMRTAEQLVDFVVDVGRGWQAFVRRLRVAVCVTP